MRIKKIEITNFKRFTHLIVEDIPETAKLVVLVGPNGSGKTSLLEAMNHFYKWFGYSVPGNYRYLFKEERENIITQDKWNAEFAQRAVDIDFYDYSVGKFPGEGKLKNRFYFRSAFRNEAGFEISSMEKQDDPGSVIRLDSLAMNDTTVSENYKRLVFETISEVYNSEKDNFTVRELREELIGKIQIAMKSVFEDLDFSSIGDPLRNGNFYFTKGSVKDFNYSNLSAGEKAAFDLILDIVVKSKYYEDAIFCIDEPEIHMHTKLQGRVIRELYKLIPGKSQLWISSHSFGVLQEAADIEKETPETVAFLDFNGRDFDDEEIIHPTKIEHTLWERFYELALGDYAKLILPETVVFCEGDQNGTKIRKDFDKSIYTIIFGNTHPKATFISRGCCNDVIRSQENLGEVMSELLQNTQVIKVIDRDDLSEQEVNDLKKDGIKVLSRRNLESYLLDDEIIEKLCVENGHEEMSSECIKDKENAISDSVKRKNAPDDLKSARSDIYNALKDRLALVRCGNNPDAFLRDTMAPLITPDTEVYKLLEEDIFG